MPSTSSINVSLTPELCDWIAAQVKLGRYRSASEVVRHAVRHLREQPVAVGTAPAVPVADAKGRAS